jgi:transcription elongation factor Elf1
VGGRCGTGRPVIEPCVYCGGRQLVAVLLPGHGDVEAVVCLVCGMPQPAEVPQPGGAEL